VQSVESVSFIETIMKKYGRFMTCTVRISF
jgi:hypothetical protein